MLRKLSIKDLDLAKKKVLMRVDFNVPIDEEGKIIDDTRIISAIPSIRYVLDHGGSVILMSHRGRPKGPTSDLSLKICADRLSQKMGLPIKMASDCIGPEVKKMASELGPGQILMLENLRFYPAEENPESDPNFAKSLALLGDVYVNDAFGTAHRAHSSTATITKFFPEKAAAGLLLEQEILFFEQLIMNPKQPFFAIIGGAKISSKIGVLEALLPKIKALFIGGAMAYTFYKAQGIPIGNSLHEDEYLEKAKGILKKAENIKVKIYLPLDNVVAKALDNESPIQIVDMPKGIPEGFKGVDIGPKTIQKYSAALREAGTVFWNGPLGVFEIDRFSRGTAAIAKALSELKNAITVVGGGESIAAVEKSGVADKISHISTGGGAALEYLEFGTLPGIESLSCRN